MNACNNCLLWHLLDREHLPAACRNFCAEGIIITEDCVAEKDPTSPSFVYGAGDVLRSALISTCHKSLSCNLLFSTNIQTKKYLCERNFSVLAELRFLAGPGGRYYSKAGAKQQERARLSAAEGAAVLRAARMGVQVPGDVKIRVRELGGIGGGGFDGGGILKAVVDVASPRARGERVK